MYLPRKQYADGSVAVAGYSPVKLIVVVMCFPPEVEPDQQQTEGEEEDDGPQQLPLNTQEEIKLIISVDTLV